ncbi:MAG: hypothetical protein IKL52_06195 [Candidatus Gastranaerophilales bacterium]|nr:hypothetical protein [Candidatus Gastranaerophilales bacterium]
MKKLLLIALSMLFLNAYSMALKGGVSEDYIPKGFFGSWGVISKLKETNNPNLFNKESRDIWSLSGYNNILFLENFETGARSQIEIKNKEKDALKFERKKVTEAKENKIIYKETVEFRLLGNRFSGIDKFIVEKYDLKNNLIEKNIATYQVEGTKISGDTPN